MIRCCGEAGQPTWFDDEGSQYNAATWQGTTWGSGVTFCDNQGMELCPYAIYCPDGGASSPIGGTKGGDMWAPVSDRANQWVQVGVWGSDAVTTCLGHHEIAGGIHGDPSCKACHSLCICIHTVRLGKGRCCAQGATTTFATAS